MCLEDKNLSSFSKDKRNRVGLRGDCRKCAAEYRKKNVERNNAYMREYIKSSEHKKWRKEYRVKPQYRAYMRKYEKEQRKNPIVRLNRNMGKMLWEALKNNKKCGKWELLDYNLNDLINHLEAQFDENITWENYGSYWHIDHIIPKNRFKYLKPEEEEFKKCWSLDNLQPLEAIKNKSKNR